jgi:hypothetical protein
MQNTKRTTWKGVGPWKGGGVNKEQPQNHISYNEKTMRSKSLERVGHMGTKAKAYSQNISIHL